MTALQILRSGGDFSRYASPVSLGSRVPEEEWLAAFHSAQRAAVILREHGAGRVMLFGSLARKEDFEPHSDIDLAVWGIPDKAFFAVGARVMDLDSLHEINIIDGAKVPERIGTRIEEEGVSL